MMGANLIDNKWVVDCATMNSHEPVFSFIMEEKVFFVGPYHYIKRQVTGTGKVECSSAFAGNNLKRMWTLGHPLLKAYYSVINFGKNSICLAQSK